jgi:hypothetical protein
LFAAIFEHLDELTRERWPSIVPAGSQPELAAALVIATASIERRLARSPAPSLPASETPAASLAVSPNEELASSGVEIMYALCAMALANNPCARVAAIRYMTLQAAGRFTAIVTLAASPPNAAEFRFTQRSASI